MQSKMDGLYPMPSPGVPNYLKKYNDTYCKRQGFIKAYALMNRELETAKKVANQAIDHCMNQPLTDINGKELEKLRLDNKEMHSLIDPIVEKMFTKLYGPKYCGKCEETQPIYVFQLDGSEELELNDSILTQSFMGSRVCRVCGHDVDGPS